MAYHPANQAIDERLHGIVTRVTYHDTNSGWSVLSVEPVGQPGGHEKVTVHQTTVFAGATMMFTGAWEIHPKYGRQFKAKQAIERKPASAAALEKYLGSGLIKGVGPKTARKIVKHFQAQTLDIFEHHIERLTEVPGIAQRKLSAIAKAWHEHSKVRDVMIFLQSHGISTLFAVRIYKTYGDQAIERVQENPYRLADDFYGIGFFSADKVALSLGFSADSDVRVKAAIKHVLSASREQGHCYLTETQIVTDVARLLGQTLDERVRALLQALVVQKSLQTRQLPQPQTPQSQQNNTSTNTNTNTNTNTAYYANALYHAENRVAERLGKLTQALPVDQQRVKTWVDRFCAQQNLTLSGSQSNAVLGIAHQRTAVLTGGPGCGKTTTTRIITKLFEAMGKRVTLVAPTGRAAQRMGEVIGREAKTIHRLLQWKGGQFEVNEQAPLETDVLIIDECSMLDITLADALLRALPAQAQLLMIGDADQLPAVGPGNVLKDIIAAGTVPCYALTEVFRQAKASNIIQYAHDINNGKVPPIPSPFNDPNIWHTGTDCLLMDSDEATQAQLRFIRRIKHWLPQHHSSQSADTNLYQFRCDIPITSPYEKEFEIPPQFAHVNLNQLKATTSEIAAFKSVLKNIHPWSSLHYDLPALEVVERLYQEWIPKYLGAQTEIQVLSPMARGSLGTHNLNLTLQEKINPASPDTPQLLIGQRAFRLGDRVIHRRNNYELNVYNGDIGKIININTETVSCDVCYEPDARKVTYSAQDLTDLDLAYAITIHKSQGSEFEAVIIPVLTQHFTMLHRNLLYTGLTRAKRFAIFVGSRRALTLAARNNDTQKRQTALRELLQHVLPLHVPNAHPPLAKPIEAG